MTRYIFHKSQFSSSNNRVRHQVCMPDSSGETSVFHIKGLTEEEIWGLGAIAEERKGTPPKARGDISIADIEGLQPRLDRDGDPPRHANITNWPGSKDERIAKAQELALKAILRLRPA